MFESRDISAIKTHLNELLPAISSTMPLFKKKPDTLIPPVSAPSAPSPTYGNSPRSSSNTYVASRDGDSYNTASRLASYDSSGDNGSLVDKYNRNRGVGDIYTRGGAELEKDRNELFSGYTPSKSGGSGRFFDGPDIGRTPPLGEENDEDIEGIKQQTRFVKQESVNSTRNALRLAREAEETARNTLTRLGDQSGITYLLLFASLDAYTMGLEKLANTERHLDVSKGHSQRATDKTDELKQLNRSIFRPVITFNKDAKRAAQDAKLQARYEEERDEREKAMMDIRDTQNRIGRAATYGRAGDDDEIIGGGGSGRFKTAEQLSARKDQRKRYQFESNASDDEIEDELDDNLDEISDMTKRLKALGTTMGDELDKQNGRVKRIEEKTVGLDDRIFQNTERVSQPSKLRMLPSYILSFAAQEDQVGISLSPPNVYHVMCDLRRYPSCLPSEARCPARLSCIN